MRLLPVVLLLAGCAAPAMHWVRADYTPEKFEMESGQCEAQSLSATATIANGFGAVSQRDRIYAACMRGKGWTQKTP